MFFLHIPAQHSEVSRTHQLCGSLTQGLPSGTEIALWYASITWKHLRISEIFLYKVSKKKLSLVFHTLCFILFIF